MSAQTYLIGSVRVHLISDGVFVTDGGVAFGIVPKALWEMVAPPDPRNFIRMDLRSLVIESSEGLILVDTGHGHKLAARRRQQLGLADDYRVDNALAEVGFRAEDVRLVVNTHLHADHCGGNTLAGPDGRVLPAFPNATYLMQRLELADATYPNERTRNTYFCDNFLPLVSLCGSKGDRPVRVLNGDTQLLPKVRVLVTPGHTRSHQVVIVEDGGETGIFLGDAAGYAVNLERLAWVPSYDVEPLVSIETKRSLRDWAWRRDALLFFQHDPSIAAGCLRREGDNWRVEAAMPLERSSVQTNMEVT